MKLKTRTTFLVAALGLTFLSHGAVTYYASTDASGNFINASGGGTAGTPATWSGGLNGNGTVQPNVALATNAGSIFEMLLVDDFSNNATLGNLSMDRDGTFFDVVLNLVPEVAGAHSADLKLTNPNGSANTDDWGSFRMNDFDNVKGFSITVNFDEPVAARLSSTFNSVQGLGLRRHSGSAMSYDAAMSVTGLTTILALPPTGVTPVQGTHYALGSSGTPINIDQGGGSNLTFSGAPYANNATNFGSKNGITATNEWVALHGVDSDGDGDVDNSLIGGSLDGETELTYISSMTLDITSSDGSAFPSNTQFEFSVDGSQYTDTLDIAKAAQQIPEPTGVALLGIASLSLLTRRKR